MNATQVIRLKARWNWADEVFVSPPVPGDELCLRSAGPEVTVAVVVQVSGPEPTARHIDSHAFAEQIYRWSHWQTHGVFFLLGIDVGSGHYMCGRAQTSRRSLVSAGKPSCRSASRCTAALTQASESSSCSANETSVADAP